MAGAAAAAVTLGVAFSGAAVPAVLRDPGALVRWGLPVVETLTQLAGAVTIGALVLMVCVLPRRVALADGAASATTRPSSSRRARTVVDGRAYPAAGTLAGSAAAAWTGLSIAQLILTYASVAGRPVGGATFGAELGVFVGQISLGRTLLAVTLVAAATSALALAVATPTGAAWATALAAVALALQAQSGHVAGAANHELAISSMFAHLAGAAVWIGALAALAVLARRLGADLGPSIARYSPIAAWCFVAVALSGVVNSAARLGGLDGLATRYGALLVVKVALMAVLGGLGWAYRRSVIARLLGADGGTRAGQARSAAAATRVLWRLIAVELFVMGAVSGVAVALASTAPPIAIAPPIDPTPAELVTGHVLPPELTTARWLTEFRWDVLLAGACLAGVVVYLRWVRRLRARGDAWPPLRTASWLVGMLVLAWITSGGAATYGHVLFSAHMVQHMVLALVVPIFLVLAAPVTLALRALPGRPDDSRGPREWILTLVTSHVAQFFANPLVAAVNFAGSMVVFYYTDLFEYSLRYYAGHLAMVVHFTLVGYLFANALIGIDPGPRRPGYPQRLLLLFATMGFHAFFGITLVSSTTLLVADWFGLTGRPWGVSAIEDQQIGGSIAWGIGELPTLALALVVAFSWSRSDERTARQRDRRVDRDGDLEMDAYNAELARIAERDARQPDRP
ncbi:bifunctional copper resistance protein CopD/cytochrome c oxidase assembly protein [Pengzhenrongella sicca]|uniref:Bifunctional copper resistance protein CopD/cytochrome c oxidase assembly protein n=2 Tax=Pengzhenrongella sicca TaxID=2819238 RepID=A0A8A4ZK65_9MICO|nr:bifunctional copper resistance protein CopD/cytochrome c oxidase assembly protein [Pengzhenrongella sicca]